MPFVASGAMLIAASTNRFVAGPVPLGPLLPDVERLTVAWFVPSVNTTSVLAFRVNVVAVGLFTVTVHVYVPFACSAGEAHVLELVCGATGSGESTGVTDTDWTVAPLCPAGVTVIVNVCDLVTSLIALGAMPIDASTNRFIFEPLPTGP